MPPKKEVKPLPDNIYENILNYGLKVRQRLCLKNDGEQGVEDDSELDG